jgi:chorismate synthase
MKAVEVGLGLATAALPGSQVHDPILYDKNALRFVRPTNHAGGIEGGMSNGEDITLRAAMKPIPTLMKPLRSVDLESRKPFKAAVERSDVCAAPAAAVVGESVVAFELANAFLEKFGGDSLREINRNYENYLEQIKNY